MKKNNMITPQGTKDLLFEQCSIRRIIENNLSELFQKRGFSEVITPGIEFYDVFDLKSANIPKVSMYKLTDSKGRLIVLRPDLTIPIARLTATRLKNSPLPIRLYYNQNIFTANHFQNCASDEIAQMGIEIIGSDTLRTDLEILTTATIALQSFDAIDFKLEIGHIAIFNSLLKKLDVDEDTGEQIRQLIEAKNYPALNDILDKASNKQIAELLKQLPQMFGGIEVLNKAQEIFTDSEERKIIEYLKKLYSSLSELNLDDKISIDLGIVNKVDYYSGVVFRGYIEGFGNEILSGGRYDNLISEFGLDLPAAGFGINIDAVLISLVGSKSEKKNKQNKTLLFSEIGFEMKGLLRQQQLINQGETVEYCTFETIEKAIEYAKSNEFSELEIVTEKIERKMV